MKPFNYCPNDLKMLEFYLDYVVLIFSKVISIFPFVIFFQNKVLALQLFLQFSMNVDELVSLQVHHSSQIIIIYSSGDFIIKGIWLLAT